MLVEPRSKRGATARAGGGREAPTSADGVVAVLRTADRLRRHLSRIVELSGVTRQQYNVLRILRGARPEGLPTMEIRERMMEQAPGITRLVDHLMEKGWVDRRPSADDRRQIYCRITRAGLELLGELDGPVDAADERAFAGLGPRRLATLILLLEAVEDNLPSG